MQRKAQVSFGISSSYVLGAWNVVERHDGQVVKVHEESVTLGQAKETIAKLRKDYLRAQMKDL